jgi:hypothetical protein
VHSHGELNGEVDLMNGHQERVTDSAGGGAHRRRWRLRAVLVGMALMAGACGEGAGPTAGGGSTTLPAPTADGATTTTTDDAASAPPVAEPGVARDEIGTYPVGQRQVDLVDTSRPTAANGDAPASDERALPTAVFYPAVGDPGDDPLSPTRSRARTRWWSSPTG